MTLRFQLKTLSPAIGALDKRVGLLTTYKAHLALWRKAVVNQNENVWKEIARPEATGSRRERSFRKGQSQKFYSAFVYLCEPPACLISAKYLRSGDRRRTTVTPLWFRRKIVPVSGRSTRWITFSTVVRGVAPDEPERLRTW